MTGDRGELPPQRQTNWWPPSPPATPQPAHPPSSGNGIADLRERVARIETTLPHLERQAADRHASQAHRLTGLEMRLQASEHRSGQLDSRLTVAVQAAAPLPGVEVRLAHLERRAKMWKDMAQYAVAALIVGLVLARKLTVDQAAALLKLILPLGG
jgi:hypothetical protein